MKENTIITVSRQFGSGGRAIAERLSEILNIPYYDNKIIQKAAEKSGYAKEIFEQAEQSPTGSLLYSLSMFAQNSGVGFELPLQDKVFLVQSEVIKEAASQGGCIIVGRCADYVLRENKNVTNIYLCAETATRVARIAELYKMTEERARETVVKTDKRRAAYYNFYTGLRWGQAENYQLCLNTTRLGVDKSAELLSDYLQKL